MGLSLSNRINAWSFALVFLTTTTLVSAQNLQFLQPQIAASNGGNLPYYTEGDYVTVSWQTPFEETTLFIYQLDTNTYSYEVLALNYPQNSTTFTWTAGAVDGLPLTSDHPFKFVVENGNSYSCQGCVEMTGQFNVVSNQQSVSSGGAGSSQAPVSTPAGSSLPAQTSSPNAAVPTTQNTPPSTASQAVGPQPTQASQQQSATQGQTHQPSAAGASGDQDQSTPSPSGGGGSDGKAIGLGVGLGLGIPLLLAFIGLLIFLGRREDRKKKRISYRPTESGNWTAEGDEKSTRPESDALGPWAAAGAGAGGAGFGAGAREAASRDSRMSQTSRASSHAPSIAPFDFEKAERRDRDEMSQVRRSIHSSGSGVVHHDSGSEYSQDDEKGHQRVPSAATTAVASSSRDSPDKQVPIDSDRNGGYENGHDPNKYAWMGGASSPTTARNGFGAGTAAARRSDVSWANTDISSLEGIPETMQPAHMRYGPEFGGSPTDQQYMQNRSSQPPQMPQSYQPLQNQQMPQGPPLPLGPPSQGNDQPPPIPQRADGGRNSPRNSTMRFGPEFGGSPTDQRYMSSQSRYDQYMQGQFGHARQQSRGDGRDWPLP